MDNSDRQINRQNDLLGVNKMGKNIRKSPLHQPNFADTARQQPQPQVYNINKNDFRSIVQQLTGSPSQEPPPPRPPQNLPRPPSNRLQRIRPPPLAPINRPPMPIHPQAPVPAPAQPQVMAAGPYNNNFVRPPPQYGQQYGQPQLSPPMLPPTASDVWSNTAVSPISAYMRYLQNSIVDSGPRPPPMQPQQRPHPPSQPRAQTMQQAPGHNQYQPRAPGLLPNPHAPALPSPRMSRPPPLPSPRLNGQFPSLPSPRQHGPPPPLLSPQTNGSPPLLPSPTSQFLLPSPSGFLNLLSPRSHYPLLSPGFQHPPLLSPNFSFSPMAQSGILGAGPQPPRSPGYGFPLSPGFFHIQSPRWRDQ